MDTGTKEKRFPKNEKPAIPLPEEIEKARFIHALACDKVFGGVSNIPKDHHLFASAGLAWVILPHVASLQYDSVMPSSFVTDAHASSSPTHVRHACCGQMPFEMLSSQRQSATSAVDTIPMIIPPYPYSCLDISSSEDAMYSSWCRDLLKQVRQLNEDRTIVYLHTHNDDSVSPPVQCPMIQRLWPRIHDDLSKEEAENKDHQPLPDIIVMYPKIVPPVWFKLLVSQLRQRYPSFTVHAMQGGSDDVCFVQLVNVHPKCVWMSVTAQNPVIVKELGSILTLPALQESVIK